MLDLKKLEKQIDDALSKETPESLNAWLKAKRKGANSNALISGEGIMIDDYYSCFDVEEIDLSVAFNEYNPFQKINFADFFDFKLAFDDNGFLIYEPSFSYKDNPPNKDIIKSEKMTSNVSGSFFFINLAS